MRMKRTFTLWSSLAAMLLLLYNIAPAKAQSGEISGSVTDKESGTTIPGVNILVKGTVNGTITDTKGNFSLKVTTFPATLVFSYLGYKEVEQEVTGAESGLEVTMEETSTLGQTTVVSASRVEESIMESPVTVEQMDSRAVREAAAPSFYDGLVGLKGVDVSAQSLTFKSINTRGFGSNGNVRVVQLIDGVDNQAPGLNFPVGNIVGISELDLESVEILPGAASALYGPNAINGIVLMNSKSPFDYQGLSAIVKTGVIHVDGEDDDPSPYQNYVFRYAKAFNNKLAFKVNASYLRANDFRGVDYRDMSNLVENGATERLPGNRTYDGVNTYGDFLITVGNIADLQVAAGNQDVAATRTLYPDGAAGAFTPKGYRERDFVDNTTESLKLNAALHYKINDKVEAFTQFNWGQGSTVYTANDRFVLDNFTIWNAKLEFRGPNFFARVYRTTENSGDSYAANTLASLVNQQVYLPVYFETFAGSRTMGNDVNQAHADARAAADAAWLDPASPEFAAMTDTLRDIPISEGGARFLDRTSLYHAEAMYNFKEMIDPELVGIKVGGNFRRYDLRSDGTLFALQENGDEFDIDEFGAYVELDKKLFENKLQLAASLRYDKNEYFKGQFSPRFSAVVQPMKNHNFRLSYQRGFRIPTTQDQFIDLDVVSRRLVGSNPALVDRYRFEENTVYRSNSVQAARAAVASGAPVEQAIGQLAAHEFEEFQPEKVNTFEIGYKTLLNNKLYIDGYYYYSIYQDFIAEVSFVQAIPNGLRNPGPADPSSDAAKTDIVNGSVVTQEYGFDINADGNVLAQGFALGVDYALPKNFYIGGNVAYNELISQEDLQEQGFEAQFNTPLWRYNLKFYNREIVKNVGFNLNWRWQDAYLWESAFGTGVIPAFSTLDAQVSYKIPNLKTIVKLGGQNVLNQRYTTSFGNPRMGAIYYISITFDEFIR